MHEPSESLWSAENDFPTTPDKRSKHTYFNFKNTAGFLYLLKAANELAFGSPANSAIPSVHGPVLHDLVLPRRDMIGRFSSTFSHIFFQIRKKFGFDFVQLDVKSSRLSFANKSPLMYSRRSQLTYKRLHLF